MNKQQQSAEALRLWAQEWQLAGQQLNWLGKHSVHVSTRPDSWVRVGKDTGNKGWWVNGFVPGAGVTIPYNYKTLDEALDVASRFLRSLDEGHPTAREFLKKVQMVKRG
jgi:hypothetical protein